MTKPQVSIVVETITVREHRAPGLLAGDLRHTLEALHQQTYPRESIELIVVLDREAPKADCDELLRCYPSVKFVSSLASNYFAAKNLKKHVGFERLRKNVNSNYSDERLFEMIDRFPDRFRRVTLRGDKPAVGLVKNQDSPS